MPKLPTPVSKPAGRSGMPKSKFGASAAPMNAARSLSLSLTGPSVQAAMLATLSGAQNQTAGVARPVRYLLNWRGYISKEG